MDGSIKRLVDKIKRRLINNENEKKWETVRQKQNKRGGHTGGVDREKTEGQGSWPNSDKRAKKTKQHIKV